MLNVVFFITTRGRYGCKDIHKYALESTLEQINSLRDIRVDKFVSVKCFKGDRNTILPQLLNDFNTFVPFVWYQDNQNLPDNPQKECYDRYLLGNYFIDLVNTLSLPVLLKNTYTYLIEDDSPLIILQKDFKYYFGKAKETLESGSGIFSIFFRREGKKPQQSDYLCLHNDEKIEGDFLSKRYECNLQNKFFKTENMHKAMIRHKEWIKDLLFTHPERAMHRAIEYSFPNAQHICFNSCMAHSVHLGHQNSNDWIEAYGFGK